MRLPLKLLFSDSAIQPQKYFDHLKTGKNVSLKKRFCNFLYDPFPRVFPDPAAAEYIFIIKKTNGVQLSRAFFYSNIGLETLNFDPIPVILELRDIFCL